MAETLSEADVVGRVQSGVLVNGRWGPGGDSGTFTVENPATGQTLCSVADATPADALAALDAAGAAQTGAAADGISHRAMRTVLTCV